MGSVLLLSLPSEGSPRERFHSLKADAEALAVKVPISFSRRKKKSYLNEKRVYSDTGQKKTVYLNKIKMDYKTL